jgi:hypothetical protein
MRWPRIASVLLLGALGFAARATAQGAAGFQDIDTSIRAAGMGGATTAVGWGEPGVWGNPAALANVRGIAWLEGTTRLLPEIDPEIRFKTRRFLLGAAGVGVSVMGEPVDGVGHTRLEFQTIGTDPFGNPTIMDLTSEIDGWGVAVSPIQLVDAIRARNAADAPALAPRFDVSAGYHHKHTRHTLFSGTTAEADNHDWGVLARVGLVAGESERSTRFEISAGFAELNGDENSRFVFPGFGDAGPSTHIRRTGAAVRVLLPIGDGAPDARPWAWPGALPSAVGVGVAYDRDERENPSTGLVNDLDHWGFEATLMDVLFARVGYLDDPASDVHDLTAGAGLHLPVGPWATVGYDWAHHPSVPGMKNMNRHGWSVWLHPDAFWRGSQEAK